MAWDLEQHPFVWNVLLQVEVVRGTAVWDTQQTQNIWLKFI